MTYYGQFLLDKYLHENYFKNIMNGIFVECGACDGVLESTCKFFEESLGWNGINIEASPPLFEMLKINRPNSVNINCALSNFNGESVFTHAIHPNLGNRFGNGSLNHTDFHKKMLINDGCSFKEYTVQCKKFVDIFIYPKEIDLFVLDVEGGELEALTGILEIDKKYYPKVFCIEHTMVGLDNLKIKLEKDYILKDIQQHNAIFLRK